MIAGGFDGSLQEDGSITVEIQAIVGATNELGFNRRRRDSLEVRSLRLEGQDYLSEKRRLYCEGQEIHHPRRPRWRARSGHRGMRRILWRR